MVHSPNVLILRDGGLTQMRQTAAALAPLDVAVDAQLPLQDLLHRVYDSAGYHDYVYDGPPEPRLAAEDAAWAEQLLAAVTG